MHGPEQSDTNIVPKKPANKAPRWAAEQVEGRAVTKGNMRHVTRTGQKAGRACPGADACTASPSLGHSRWTTAACRHTKVEPDGVVPRVRSVQGVPGNRYPLCDIPSHYPGHTMLHPDVSFRPLPIAYVMIRVLISTPAPPPARKVVHGLLCHSGSGRRTAPSAPTIQSRRSSRFSQGEDGFSNLQGRTCLLRRGSEPVCT